jgi:hypothetical protein
VKKEGGERACKMRAAALGTWRAGAERLVFALREKLRVLEASGGSVESQERKALWVNRRKNPRGSPLLGVKGFQGRYASILVVTSLRDITCHVSPGCSSSQGENVARTKTITRGRKNVAQRAINLAAVSRSRVHRAIWTSPFPGAY